MKRPVAVSRIVFACGIVLIVVSSWSLRPAGPGGPAVARAQPAPTRDDAASVAQLQAQVKALQGLAPDQAAVMSHVGYHFANLWFAIDRENWPLADFYLGEARGNVKWAVRAKPVRKNGAGQEIDLAGLAQAIDNGVFTDLKRAIDAKDKPLSVRLYDDALTNCYACHKASSKPYLRPRRPERAEAPIINADPKATWPE